MKTEQQLNDSLQENAMINTKNKSHSVTAEIETLYNEHHFFVPNEINRYSVGTKNKDLKLNSDGSLTFYVQSDLPKDHRPQ